jgi:ribosomal protein S3
MTQTLFVWWSVGPVNSILILWEVLKKGSSEIKVKNRIQRPLTIVNINFQSIKNKKPELDILLDTTKPDVIIGTGQFSLVKE